MKKLFITLEGGEGSGKSTIAKALKEALTARNLNVKLTREPGGCDFAEEVRELIMKHHDLSKYTELLLFNAARTEHVKEIKNMLEAEVDVVICDRFTDSTWVYQTTANDGSNDETLNGNIIQLINSWATQDREPDLTFIIDIDPEIAASRIKSDDAREVTRFDKMELEYHNTIRDKFNDLVYVGDRYHIIDGTKDLETKVEEIIKILENK